MMQRACAWVGLNSRPAFLILQCCSLVPPKRFLLPCLIRFRVFCPQPRLRRRRWYAEEGVATIEERELTMAAELSSAISKMHSELADLHALEAQFKQLSLDCRLLVASSCESEVKARVLLEEKADPLMVTPRGVTALMVATDSCGSRLSVVRLLLRAASKEAERREVERAKEGDGNGGGGGQGGGGGGHGGGARGNPRPGGGGAHQKASSPLVREWINATAYSEDQRSQIVLSEAVLMMRRSADDPSGGGQGGGSHGAGGGNGSSGGGGYPLSETDAVIGPDVDLGPSPSQGRLAPLGGVSALALASMRGQSDVLRELLKAKASPHVKVGSAEMTPLMFAAKYGNDDCVRRLLEFEPSLCADVNAFGRDALMLACLYGHDSTVRMLLDHITRLHPDSRRGSLAGVVGAARESHAAVFKQLSQALERADADGWSVLHFACW